MGPLSRTGQPPLAGMQPPNLALHGVASFRLTLRTSFRSWQDHRVTRTEVGERCPVAVREYGKET